MFYILLILLYSTSLSNEGGIERTKSNLFVMGITYSFQSETNENFQKLSIKNIGTYIGNIVRKKLYNIDLKVIKSILLSMLQFWLISSDERD